MTISANSLRPGAAGSVFQIPVEDWTLISKRVYDVNMSPWADPYQFQQLPNYDALLGVCQQWLETYRQLMFLCVQIDTYAAKNVGETYPALKAAFAQLQQTPGSQSALSVITNDLDVMLQQSKIIKGQVGAVATQIGPFRQENENANAFIASHPEMAHGQPIPDLAALRDGLDKMLGAWDAIASDIADLQSNVREQVAESNPVLLNLEIDAAMSEWAEIRQAFDAFMSDSGRQRNIILYGHDHARPPSEQGSLVPPLEGGIE